MENEEHIVRYTLTELKDLNARGTSKTDWARIDAMTDDELEATIDWEEEGKLDLSQAFPGFPPGIGRAPTMRVAGDVVSWFKAQGRDYRTRMRAVLRDYVDSQHVTPTAQATSQQRKTG